MWPGPRLCSARRYGVFDPPFRWFKPRDLLEMGTADKNYRGLTRFIAEAGDRLRPGGRILLNFGTSGDIDYLYRRIEKAGLSKEVTPYGEATRDGMTARYYTIRMLFIGSAEDASLRAVATSPLLWPDLCGPRLEHADERAGPRRARRGTDPIGSRPGTGTSGSA
jgi:hypothetical protein